MNLMISHEPNAGGGPTGWQLGYLFLRIMLGLNLFGHGFNRLVTGLSAWEQPMAETFVGTYLPMAMVHAVLYSIPVIEFTLGTLLLLGLFTRWAVIGAAVLLILLMFGHTVRQTWSTVHVIMAYGIYLWALLVLEPQNWLALDNRRKSST
jgi:thiosulfate dehydrogenase [quinone] large subunit